MLWLVGWLRQKIVRDSTTPKFLRMNTLAFSIELQDAEIIESL